MSAAAKSAVPPSGKDYHVADIGQAGWDACAANPAYRANPFVSFDFLDIAEAAGCAVERAGWGPQHIAVEDEAGAVAAVMPLYLKSHSQGEYVFDHGWAEAYERAAEPDPPEPPPEDVEMMNVTLVSYIPGVPNKLVRIPLEKD